MQWAIVFQKEQVIKEKTIEKSSAFTEGETFQITTEFVRGRQAT